MNPRSLPFVALGLLLVVVSGAAAQSSESVTLSDSPQVIEVSGDNDSPMLRTVAEWEQVAWQKSIGWAHAVDRALHAAKDHPLVAMADLTEMITSRLGEYPIVEQPDYTGKVHGSALHRSLLPPVDPHAIRFVTEKGTGFSANQGVVGVIAQTSPELMPEDVSAYHHVYDEQVTPSIETPVPMASDDPWADFVHHN